eukprot:7924952-Alexandrium_andersonii.AAC.2
MRCRIRVHSDRVLINLTCSYINIIMTLLGGHPWTSHCLATTIGTNSGGDGRPKRVMELA